MADLPRHEVERIPFYLHWQEKSAFKETYAGPMDTVVVEGQHLKPKGVDAKTVIVFMHPSGTMNLLPMPNALAAAGIPCLTCGSRYPHNDTALIMEKVILDLGHYIRYAKEKLGYERVILGGWSGGGSLSMFYQSQAERPSIEATPAGDPVNVKGAGLIPADAVLQLAAHVSRAITLTEWLDPSIIDEQDPDNRDISLDLYAEDGPQPPYTDSFLATYRRAQVQRSAKIDAFVRQKLEDLKNQGRPNEEFSFVVHGTMADPRWLDLSVDPNDRKGPNWCYMGEPRIVNMMPAGLARYCSLRAWLSQWSFAESRADGPRCAGDVSVPVLVIENTADDACTPSHAARIYAGILHEDKELHEVKGATHYYIGQPDKMAEACHITIDWLERKGMLA